MQFCPLAEMQALPLAPRPQEGGVEGGVGRRPGHGPRVGRVPPDGLHGEVPPVLGGPGHLHLHYVPVKQAEGRKLYSILCYPS